MASASIVTRHSQLVAKCSGMPAAQSTNTISIPDSTSHFQFAAMRHCDNSLVMAPLKDKRRYVDAFSRHRNFLKQRTITSYACGQSDVAVKSLQQSDSCIKDDDEARGSAHVEVGSVQQELWSVMGELEEVAITLVYSNGSSQLRRPTVRRI